MVVGFAWSIWGLVKRISNFTFFLGCVWIEYFNEAIHFFEEFRFLCNEMFCLDREIKKHFKCKHFFEGFQLAKLVEIQIPLK